MKILIIEDEELAARRMMQLLKELEPGAELSGPYDTVVSSVEHLKNSPAYDLIFLDIQLADGKSFSIFETLKIETPVIFTTAFDEYALKAFDLNSIDYLLKPVNKEKLRGALDKFLNIRNYFGDGFNRRLYDMLGNMKSKEIVNFKERFLVNRGDTLIPIKTGEIACFYAEDKSVLILTRDNRRFVIPNTLDELEEKLDPAHFFRANRQFIISMEAIKKVSNYFGFKLKVDIQPDPGIEIVISRARTADFKAWLSGEKS